MRRRRAAPAFGPRTDSLASVGSPSVGAASLPVRRHGRDAEGAASRRHRRYGTRLGGAHATLGPSAGAATNLVWHTTVVTAAMARLHGGDSGSMAQPGTDSDAWDTDVHELVRAVSCPAGESGTSATSLLRAVLSELHALATPLPGDLRCNNFLLGMVSEIRRGRARDGAD